MHLSISNLNVELQKKSILKDISLEMKSGEFVSLLGPSGCGKTTLLKSIAGLLSVKSGEVSLNGSSIVNLAPEKRGTVIVFQDLRLFPHMTVEQNVAFTMNLRGVPKEEQRKQVARFLEAVQLAGFEKRKIRQMSGGQRQRVALARALAADPKVLLLDEPFSSLDESLRDEMGRLVKKLHDEMKLTTIMVTHDKKEAMKLSDRIALMKEGVVLQYGTPVELFEHPNSKTVADYMGKTSYFTGEVTEDGFVVNPNGKAEVMLRPSAIHLSKVGEKSHRITTVLYGGELVEIQAESLKDGGAVLLQMPAKEWAEYGYQKGEQVALKLELDKGVIFS